jgi:cytochrome oxidase Cu insertion factor (SCO1/SenC/PrrC family)
LQQYAQIFNPQPQQWRFLTGSMSDIEQLGQIQFRVIIDKAVHTEDILLVDRWGRFRDRFRWDDPAEMQRFAGVAQQVLDETSPPLDLEIETRNLLAGNPHILGNMPQWLDEFFLTRADGTSCYSRDWIGEVWIGSVFFTSCSTHCIEQNRYLRDLQLRLADRPVRLVSITTDPQTDTPERLRRYAAELQADPEHWIFLTADNPNYAHRVASEFLGLFVSGADHATSLVVVDRWGDVRGKFNWREPAEEAKMLQLVEALRAETRPPAQPIKVSSSKSAEAVH